MATIEATRITQQQSQAKGELTDMQTTSNPTKAKGRGKELTVTLYIGGEQVETLTAEQRKRMAEKLSETMSEYYSLHPEEYKEMR